MNKLVALALLFGSTLAGKIPLTKRHLTMEGLMSQRDRLATVGSSKFLSDGLGEEVPI